MEENKEKLDSLEFTDQMDETTENEILGIEEFNQAEWVFQFDEDEPITIAWSNDETEPGELNFILKPNSGSSVSFQSNDGKKTLRIFSRNLTEDRKKQLESPNF
jgi:hypothetical protein